MIAQTPVIGKSMDYDPWHKPVSRLSQQTKESCLQIARLVDQDSDQQASATLPEERLALFKTSRAQLSLLRAAHRRTLHQVQASKERTAGVKTEVDNLHLTLSNLQYEQKHLQDEIMNCESYDHTYLALPLIPESDFLEEFSEQRTLSPSDLVMSRIAHEQTEREKLEQRRQTLLRKKQALITENNRRRDNLTNLDKDLERFIDAARPIQQLLEREDQSQRGAAREQTS